jgi:hypothetical protein
MSVGILGETARNDEIRRQKLLRNQYHGTDRKPAFQIPMRLSNIVQRVLPDIFDAEDMTRLARRLTNDSHCWPSVLCSVRPEHNGGFITACAREKRSLHTYPVHQSRITDNSRKASKPSPLAERRKINSRRGIPSRRAIAGAKLHRDVLVAIRNP